MKAFTNKDKNMSIKQELEQNLDFLLSASLAQCENLPIILTGILYGPIVGGAVGAATDLISYFLSPQIYPPNLIVTLGATMVGVVSGVTSKYIVKKLGYAKIILSGALAHIVGSMIIKPIGLFQFYQWSVLFRIPLYLIIAPIEIIILCMLYKNSAFRKLMRDAQGGSL